MTRVFIYEFVTGGGWWGVDPGHPPAGSLRKEAIAMVRALAHDFSVLPSVQVASLCDARLANVFPAAVDVSLVTSSEQERRAWYQAASEADCCVIIAPEFDGHLLSRVGWAEELNCRLLSPHSAYVAVAADKHLTAQTLIRSGFAAPRGIRWQHGEPIPAWLQWTVVLKPCDGAGSQNVRLVRTARELAAMKLISNSESNPRPMRLEEYCPGLAASVAMLCGPGGNQVLPAGRQLLSSDGHFRYVGGEMPLTPELCRRATQLAHSVANALPTTTGYVGIDVVLGDKPDGSLDFVIEINPRLTTSYVGLREICRENLAAAMLAVASGEMVPLSFDSRVIRFAVEK